MNENTWDTWDNVFKSIKNILININIGEISMNKIAVIPVRSGSKRLPKKNYRVL